MTIVTTIALLLVLLLLGFFVYRYFLKDVIVEGNLNIPADNQGAGAGNQELNLKVLQDPRFINLKQPAELPVDAGKAGRPNPFEPF